MMNVAQSIWPMIMAVMAHALSRRDADDPVCGISFAMVYGDGRTRAFTSAERAI
ncbi:hypothetical protein [Pontivivens ytuae]|uniref:Uncharacterized protein n=1 Tax=Pontivivens ytuae TaxID=2789856 RepID=A0A7S9LQE1_9RHOB|nr:hypothetical protein [Pontivivens ytuae]QPH53323.1 hypothetical protein I0K15_16250 [Pontivivens ytuae]